MKIIDVNKYFASTGGFTAVSFACHENETLHRSYLPFGLAERREKTIEKFNEYATSCHLKYDELAARTWPIDFHTPR